MIALIFTIAAVGLVFVGLLYLRLREVDRTRQLKRYRSKEPGVCDLLNYAAVVDDGVVIGKKRSSARRVGIRRRGQCERARHAT